MKQLIYFTIFTLSFSLHSQEEIVINHNAPKITFEKEIIDLGEFLQYDDSSSKCEFIFTNTGKEPLIISKAKGSCGCTVPEWPKEPILSGETGSIKVNYDEKRVGSFNKSVTITSNAQNATQILKIKGKVIAVEKTKTTPLKKKSSLAPTAK
ncbi:MAG: hypothetical protein CMP65_04605 [Flavobacteriales bacterium]|nr:hypothetical protein [Flavobacteriales bacterium]|tara:strand:- start:5821 stop:6276 length:456 start_codon:yes stop_codon:yes gene_type:complete